MNEAMIKRFHLGYALERSTALYDEAKRKGYNEKYLVDTGLCIRTDTGRVYDRFKGRVIFPVFSVAGKVIAFGGRTLKRSGEICQLAGIYHLYKSKELYGLYQAKQAIVKHNKCILVEGYLDVISMHQSGIENVVASSGTSLTDGQIRLIHRFTDNVTSHIRRRRRRYQGLVARYRHAVARGAQHKGSASSRRRRSRQFRIRAILLPR